MPNPEMLKEISKMLPEFVGSISKMLPNKVKMLRGSQHHAASKT